MRQVQEMAVEFVNALNAAAAAESECAKLRRLLEEERKLVQRLKQEKENEAQMAKRKIERMSQRLAEAQKDVEYATTRADVAESEWIKAKKELQEEKELCQSLKLECDEIRRNAMRQVEEKERELANALHASTEIAGRECAKLKRMLEVEQKLVQRLRLEKDDEAQLAKRQIEEIDQELAQTRKDAELARKDADAAENEWTKVKRDLNNMEEHVKRLELQCQEMAERASRQDGDKALELANAVNATAIAEGECAKLKRMLTEERKTVQRLIREKDDEAELANRQFERMGQELTDARNDADIAGNEWAKVKRELREKDEIIKLLKLDIQETRQIAMRQVEETTEEFEDARKEAEHARNDADIAQDEWMKAKKDLQEKLDLVQLLKLQCQEIRESAKRQVEEKELQLADALNAATAASSSSAAAQDCVICLTNVKDMAFGCGHMTCEECGVELSTCPICREDITHRIKLFPG
ncbi:nuclear-pore anchor-like [Neltuma alba]|uniref:nuclear-pore anchor-like n=1 Tax=Neltuma alba TaxID=207710 RepID=UPI0010A465A9|nr:nuclear-pore anchor-like [Prosopis alba]